MTHCQISRCDACLALSAICMRIRTLKKMTGPQRLLDIVRFPNAYPYDDLVAHARRMTAAGHRVKYSRWKGRREI
jgi:hypothetical protein